MSLITRINERLLSIGMSKADLQKKSGIKKSTFYNIFDDKTNSEKLNIETLQALAKALDVSMDYLAYGKDENNWWQTQDVSPIGKRKFYVLGDVACGQPIESTEQTELYIVAGTDIKADYVLKAKGDSMINARIKDGDYVFIRKQDAVEHRQIAAVSLDGEITLKRVLFHPNAFQPTMIILRAENPSFDDIVIQGEDLAHFRIFGIAVAFQSDIR